MKLIKAQAELNDFVFIFILIVLLSIYNSLQVNYFRISLALVFVSAFITNKVFINGFINLQFHIFYALIHISHIQPNKYV